MNDETSVRQAVEARRSIRKYTEEDIPVEVVREVVRQASLAPSAMNIQPWRVVAVRSTELRRRLRSAAHDQAQVEGAPVVLVVMMDEEGAMAAVADTVHPEFGEKAGAKAQSVHANYEGMEAAARRATFMNHTFLFVAFLVLAAQGAGYSTSVMGGFEPEKVKEVLGLPPSVGVAVLVAMGRGAEEGRPHHRHPVERILTER